MPRRREPRDVRLPRTFPTRRDGAGMSCRGCARGIAPRFAPASRAAIHDRARASSADDVASATRALRLPRRGSQVPPPTTYRPNQNSKPSGSFICMPNPVLLESPHAHTPDRQQELLQLVAAALAILAQSGLRVHGTNRSFRRKRLSGADRGISPSRRVPLLIDDGVKIWDSLAICEYAAESTGRGLPGDRIGARAGALGRRGNALGLSGFAQ